MVGGVIFIFKRLDYGSAARVGWPNSLLSLPMHFLELELLLCIKSR